MFGFIKNASKNGESYRKLYRANIGVTDILISSNMLPLSQGEKMVASLYYISCFQPLFTSQKWFTTNFDRVVMEDNTKNPNSVIGFNESSVRMSYIMLNLNPQKHLLEIIEAAKNDSMYLETALNVSSHALDVHVDNFVQNTTLPDLIKKYGDQMGME